MVIIKRLLIIKSLPIDLICCKYSINTTCSKLFHYSLHKAAFANKIEICRYFFRVSSWICLFCNVLDRRYRLFITSDLCHLRRCNRCFQVIYWIWIWFNLCSRWCKCDELCLHHGSCCDGQIFYFTRSICSCTADEVLTMKNVSPLKLAVKSENDAIVSLLIKHGANPFTPLLGLVENVSFNMVMSHRFSKLVVRILAQF